MKGFITISRAGKEQTVNINTIAFIKPLGDKECIITLTINDSSGGSVKLKAQSSHSDLLNLIEQAQ